MLTGYLRFDPLKRSRGFYRLIQIVILALWLGIFASTNPSFGQSQATQPPQEGELVGVQMQRSNAVLWLTWGGVGLVLGGLVIWVISRQIATVREQHRRDEFAMLSAFAIDNAGEGILWVNDQGRIIRANASACSMIGLSANELLGSAILDFFTHNDLAELQGRWLKDTAPKNIAFYDTLTTRDGEIHVLEIVASKLFWDGDEYLCAFLRDVTERRKTQSDLRLRTRALEAMGDGVIITDAKDANNVILYVNPAFEQITGYSANEAIGRNCNFLQAEDRDQAELGKLRQGLRSLKPCSATLRNYRKDGTLFWNQLSVWPVRDENREVTHFIGIQRDVTKQKSTEDSLRLAATVFETTTEAIMVSDADNRIKAVNPAFIAITGYSEADVIGRDPGMLSSGRQSAAFYKGMWTELRDQGRWSGEIWNRRKNGEVYPEWLSITAIHDKNGEIAEYVGVFSDISKKVEAEEQIRWQANYDALTELPNRNLFFDRLSRSISAAKRNHGKVALLFVDLDRFKIVNDTLGHHVGDSLLKAATDRLGLCVRDSDTLARFGGDEFTIILPTIEHAEDAAVVAEKIIGALSEPFDLEEHRAFVGASIGITVYPNDADDPVTMLRNADVAMYRAKDSGRNAFRFFTPEMDQQALHRMSVENDIRQGIEQGYFVSFFQPIVDCGTGRVTSAEVLVRWNHPVRGLLMPGEFIPLAEETGLIAKLGDFIRRDALKQARNWPQHIKDSVELSINLSGRELSAGFGREELAAILDETEYPADRLTLEITENVILEDSEETTRVLRDIRAMGVKFSVDDFGTGYSSLGYLKRFPLDVVKIDRSFIRDVMIDRGDASLVEAVIAMAKSLDLEVVAEGVETSEQFAFLNKLTCEKAQGYLFSHPVAGTHFPEVVEKINAECPQFQSANKKVH